MKHNTKTTYKRYLGSAYLCKDMYDLGAKGIYCIDKRDFEKIMKFSNPMYVYEEGWSKEKTNVYLFTVLTTLIAITDNCGFKVGRDVYQKFLTKSEEILSEYLSGGKNYSATISELDDNRCRFAIKIAEI